MKRLFVLGYMLCALSTVGRAQPLKVYILAGQSNMQGHGQASTLPYMADDPATKALYDKIVDARGEPRVHENVHIVAFSEAGKGQYTKKAGPVTMGYGSNLGSDAVCGPELAFGITMAETLGEPILLIKTAWGGKSLNTDFRSPSAGAYELPKGTQGLWDSHPNGVHGVPAEADRPKFWAEKKTATGHYYRLMVKHVNETLADLERAHPAYDPEQGYELAGFVWFQGWNDMCDSRTYPKSRETGGYAEYTRLMAHFIRDVRSEFKSPAMPFVIGVIGVDGEKAKGGLANLRPAMAAPASMDAFKGTVAAVQTSDFWDYPMAELAAKKGRIDLRLRAAHMIGEDGFMEPPEAGLLGWEAIGTSVPGERIWRFTTVEPTEEKEQLPKKAKKRFRAITVPDELKDWYAPDFDDSTWQSGKAPIGKGTWKHPDYAQAQFNSEWGNGEFVLMRTTFELAELNYVSFRIAVLANQGFDIYLNGHRVHTYIWWKDRPHYRPIVLEEKQANLLRKGRNVLAVCAGSEYGRSDQEPVGCIDVMIEGITEQGLEYVNSKANKLRIMDKECTRDEGRIYDGSSNGGYHYLGSGKMLSQIGEAFAKAMVDLSNRVE